MDIGFVWDEEKYWAVVESHNVRFYEVVSTLSSPRSTQKGDGLMSTIKDKECDYQAYMREHPPDPAKIHRGPHARHQRREIAKTRITIRIDEEVIEQFKQMAPEGRGYQNLINQALREWLAAQGVKELIREELSEMVHQAISSIQGHK